MTPSAAVWAHLQTWLLFAALLPPRLVMHPGLRRGVPPLLLGVTFLPLGPLDLTAWLYGYSGALSLTSMTLLAGLVARRLWERELLRAEERQALLRLLALAALLVLPPATGLGPLDPYAHGYTGLWPALLVGAAAALAWWRGLPRLGGLLLAVLWAWLLGLGESDNLWDYLMDGWLALFALAWATATGIKGLRTRF